MCKEFRYLYNSKLSITNLKTQMFFVCYNIQLSLTFTYLRIFIHKHKREDPRQVHLYNPPNTTGDRCDGRRMYCPWTECKLNLYTEFWSENLPVISWRTCVCKLLVWSQRCGAVRFFLPNLQNATCYGDKWSKY